MIPVDRLVTMMLDRDDLPRTAAEAVLLRAAFDHLDDWLLWLEDHTATTHRDDPATTVVLTFLGGVRRRVAREVDNVDRALQQIEG